MLYKSTVAQGTLELIKRLCNEPVLADFFLVGGTALSLQIGHRISIDIDLFSRQSFDVMKVEEKLSESFAFKKLYISENTLKGTIDGIFIDLLTHKYPLVNPLIVEEEIRMASLEDISAMKLNAIIGNGQRLKDFVDLSQLSFNLSLNQMIKAYKIKYNSSDEIIILKAIMFFDDIDFNVEIDLAEKKFNWKETAKQIEKIYKFPEKIFTDV